MVSVVIKSSSFPAMDMINNIESLYKRGMRQGWFRVGNILSEELNRQVLNTPKTGRTYSRRDRIGRRRRHRASAPGETPANMTGEYRRSRGYEIRGSDQLEFGLRDPKSKFLEAGTRRMDPRPGIANAVKAKDNQITPLMESSLKNEFS